MVFLLIPLPTIIIRGAFSQCRVFAMKSASEKCSKPKTFLAFLSKLLCFSIILQFTQLAIFLNVSGGCESQNNS
jgi:hypothetical protein